MKRWLTWISVIVLASILGCAYSLREQGYLSQVPPEYKTHTGGFVIFPSDSDIKAAIAFGSADRDSRAVEYAYIYKPNLDTYISVHTPLFLIADHARDKAREYQKVDSAFVEYCRKLDAVRIILHEQTLSKNYRFYAWQYNIILLRNGERIEPLKRICSYKGNNPFIKTGKQTEKLLEEIRSAQDRVYQILGTPRYKEDDYIDYTWIGEDMGIFSASELKKPGQYEVIFRTPRSNFIFAKGDEERRYPISFDHFK